MAAIDDAFSKDDRLDGHQVFSQMKVVAVNKNQAWETALI